MTKFHLIGFAFGIAFTGWLGIALYEGVVNVNLSGMYLDYTPITRAETPGKYWLAISGVTLVVAVYWAGLFWFLRHLKVIQTRQKGASGPGAD